MPVDEGSGLAQALNPCGFRPRNAIAMELAEENIDIHLHVDSLDKESQLQLALLPSSKPPPHQHRLQNLNPQP